MQTYSKSLPEYPLTPITSNWMHHLMANPGLIRNLIETYGSPINLHHIPSFLTNINGFRGIFDTHGLHGQIYFARKANKSTILVKSALDSGIGVDTASLRELEQAVALGGKGDDIVLTAAIKTAPMLRLAIERSVPIIIDNLDELQLIQHIAEELNMIANIGLRLSGFGFKGEKLYSRFGFDIDRDGESLKDWFTETPRFPNLLLTGLHFHLDGYSIDQRGEAILQSLDFMEPLEALGIHFRFLDIGGGILMNYLESKEEWNGFIARLKCSVQGKKESMTFKNNGLGFTLDQNGSLDGKLATYPYFNDIHGPEFLENVLMYSDNKGRKVMDGLKSRDLQIRIEPGRSLLGQVGVTVARVVHRKLDANGHWLVGLEMNMSQLKSSSADFLVDPFIVYHNEPENQEAIELYFTGAYCLEKDVLLKRRMRFPSLPEINDFVVFINTGGYMMHFYETQAHLFELSNNLYISLDTAETIDDIQSDETVL